MEQPPLGDRDFSLLRRLLSAHSGIALSEGKRSLLQARLGKRLRHLGLRSYREYYEHLMWDDPLAAERTAFINALTTNVTAFFRELHHFAYLKDVWLPAWHARVQRGGSRCLYIWSAGCSTGQEPYSIAITILESVPIGRGWNIRIFASDIDTGALACAQAGSYPRAEIAGLPAFLRRGYFAHAGRGLVRVAPRVRDLVRFARVNLLDESWPLPARVDVICCRNVLIYFDRPTKCRIVKRFESRLREQGLLLLGHSEGLVGVDAHFRAVGPSMYQRLSDATHDVPVATA
jgi:chemotaxis protein methyltransferase CheR